MSKFFQTTKKGETLELKEELNSESKDKQKNAIKKVIASMTVGRDVSSLFSDVTRLISTVSIDIKKLVYLYVMSTAKSQPEKAVLLAGSFVRDSQHESPLIRGLAIRTMSAVNVEKMADYLADPLKRALRDSDPYVRKTAAIAVAKMYTINRSKVEEGGFLEILQELLCDSNPTVVSNAVAALTEIREVSGTRGIRGSGMDNDLAEYKPQTVHTLLNALNEASEWGQVYILEGLSGYTPKTQEEADLIAERIVPRLQHGNAAVVLAGVKLLVQYLETWAKRLPSETRADTVRKFCAKMAPPLVSLISGGQEFEIRYVALRNITLIIQRFPDLLTNQMKIFFVKYNDPIFIKLEKLDIMLALVDAATVDICLSEFLEYASEVDVEFVRKAVRAIGRTAVKIEAATQKCIDVLLQLIKTRINYVVQEGIIVIKDIFRKYPNRYESIIGALCENLDTLDEPDAKASMIWIIGEYAERIENADELLDMFVESFDDEPLTVKLTLLTATVKLFLKRPGDTQELLQSVLKLASESDIPDLRDRGFMYWRLLSADPEAAKDVVLCPKDSIDDSSSKHDADLLDELLMHIASLASVYHKPPSAFLADYLGAAPGAGPKKVTYMEDEDEDEQQEGDGDDQGGSSAPQGELDLLGDFDDIEVKPKAPAAAPTAFSAVPAKAAPPKDDPLDLLGAPTPAPAPAHHAPAPAGDGFDDFFGAPAPRAPLPSAAPQVPRKTVLTPDKGFGAQLDCAYVAENNVLYMDIVLANKGNQALMGFAMQINKNVYGVALAGRLEVPEPLMPGAAHSTKVPLTLSGAVAAIVDLQIALKTNAGVAYFIDQLPFDPLVDKKAAVDKQAFLNVWRTISQEATAAVPCSTPTEAGVQARLEAHGIKFVANRPNPPAVHVYYAAKTLSGSSLLVEVVLTPGSPQANVCVRSDAPQLSQPFLAHLKSILQ
jgi:AP-1 complex subunit beta-1